MLMEFLRILVLRKITVVGIVVLIAETQVLEIEFGTDGISEY